MVVASPRVLCAPLTIKRLKSNSSVTTFKSNLKTLQTGSNSTSWLAKDGCVKAQGMYADGMFTVQFPWKPTTGRRPGEIIRCIDTDDYSTFSFPVGTRVTFSIDDTTTEEESRELRRVESHLESKMISLVAKTQHHYLATRKTHH